MLYVTEKREPVERRKERGDIFKLRSQGDDRCSGILNGYKQGKMGFVKAREEHVAVTEM